MVPALIKFKSLCRYLASGDAVDWDNFSFPARWGLELSVGDLLLLNGKSLESFPEEFEKKYLHAVYRWENQNIVRRQVQNDFLLNGIRCVPLKGAWFMQKEARPRRPMADLDLLIPMDQRNQAEALLLESGFTVTDSFHSRFHFHKTFRHTSEVRIELHWHIGLNDFHRISIEQVWQCAKFDQGVWKLDPNQNVCHILYHSALHFFDRPDRIFDLAVLYADKSIDWAKVESIARSWGLLGYVHLSFEFMQRFFDADLKPQAKHRSAPQVTALVDRYMKEIEGDVRPLTLWDRWQLADHQWHGVRGVFSPQRWIGAGIDRLS